MISHSEWLVQGVVGDLNLERTSYLQTTDKRKCVKLNICSLRLKPSLPLLRFIKEYSIFSLDHWKVSVMLFKVFFKD